MIKLNKELVLANGKKIDVVDRVEDQGTGFVKVYFEEGYETVLKSKIEPLVGKDDIYTKADTKKAIKKEKKQDENEITLFDTSKIEEYGYNDLKKFAKILEINPMQTKVILKAEILKKSNELSETAEVIDNPEIDEEKEELLKIAKEKGFEISNAENITVEDLKELLGE